MLIPAVKIQQGWNCWILYLDLSLLGTRVPGGNIDCSFLVQTNVSWRTVKYNLPQGLWLVVKSRGMVRLRNFLVCVQAV